VIAHVVAAPVLERIDGGALRVNGAPYVDLDGFVVAVTGPGVPLMPNGIALTAPPAAGTVRLAGARVWDPALPPPPPGRGEQILEALSAAPALDDRLREALATRDPELAARAAGAMIGLGPGLTPEGDDQLAAAAAVVAASWPPIQRGPWLRALLPPDLRARTTALSATLLELATAGYTIEPLHALLAPGDRWHAALQRLLRVGHSTGRAYAVAAAYAAASCTS
jgi:Protein of unknown function (DUF2877)